MTTQTLTVDDLVDAARRASDQIAETREAVVTAADRYAAAVAELSRTVGPTEAGRRLGITRQRVHQLTTRAGGNTS